MSYIDIELVPESRRSGVKSRASTIMVAKCIVEKGGHQDIRIRNLSNTGLGGLCVGGFGFARGDKVTIILRETTWITGCVVWADGRRFGIIFDRPFDTGRLDIGSWWKGPKFEVAALHAPVERSWRPAVKS